MTSRAIVAILAFVVFSPDAHAHIDGLDDGRGAEYWWRHSVVYAEVESVGPRELQSPGLPIVVRPLGTLSGRFDPGKSHELRTYLLFNNIAVGTRARPPIAGDAILLVIEEDWDGKGGYGPGNFVAYMPGNAHEPNTVITGLSDRLVPATRRVVEELRKHDDLPGRPTWQDRVASVNPPTIVCAELTDAKQLLGQPGASTRRSTAPFALHPLSVMLGSNVPDFIPVWNWDGVKRFHADFKAPPVGATVIAALTVDVGRNWNFVSAGAADFMPGDHSQVCSINGLNDPRVAETINALRRSRYWEMHSLVYAEIEGTNERGGENPRLTINLRPTLTLSGAFDCGKMPNLSASISTKEFDPHFNLRFTGPKALVVLVRTGDSYSISPAQSEFMPDDHAPVCTVKDFDDPKVKKTLEAVQKLRHASDEAKPKNDSAKP